MTGPFPYNGMGTFSPKVHSYSILRKQVSQGGGGTLGIQVTGAAGLAEAEELSVILYLDADFDGTNAYEDENPLGVEIARYSGDAITRESLGVYSFSIGPVESGVRGNLAAVWSYTVNGVSLSFTDHLQVTEHMPHYELLSEVEKDAVDKVQWMLGDLFDSTNGGPNLAENFQTHYGTERIAQLMAVAVDRMNFTGIPMTNFGVGPGVTPVPSMMAGLLPLGTYLEVLKHFMRSYVEQPEVRGMQTTYTDRRDYLQRWKQIHDDEKRDYEKMLSVAKRKLLGLGRGSLLVSGGIYGGQTNYFRSGTYAAQTRSQRFYPAAPSVAGFGR